MEGAVLAEADPKVAISSAGRCSRALAGREEKGHEDTDNGELRNELRSDETCWTAWPPISTALWGRVRDLAESEEGRPPAKLLYTRSPVSPDDVLRVRAALSGRRAKALWSRWLALSNFWLFATWR